MAEIFEGVARTDMAMMGKAARPVGPELSQLY